MIFVGDGGDGPTVLVPAPPNPTLPPAPSPPSLTPPAPPGGTTSKPGSGGPVNANGENLAEAEAAVLAEVAAGSLGADALARHPLPPGTSSAEALRFLASLPATEYTLGQPGGTVIGPPVGGSGAVPPTDGGSDEGQASLEAWANHPNLGNLPPWALEDTDAERSLASASSGALKGNAALASIAQNCQEYEVDLFAALANALNEGASGAIGDQGWAYGPFQDHLTHYAGRPFYGKGQNNKAVNSWAWSDNGIAYAIRQMALGKPSAKGLRGHAAVYAIVYGYEKPGALSAAYHTRAATYDRIAAYGPGWQTWVAGQLHGPAGGAASGGGGGDGGGTQPVRPAGVTSAWRDLVDFYKVTVPARHHAVQSILENPKELFK